mmetsp:Transcript_24127/g.50087  ORF Transcript_24127/g.50087 Transcript_24127/m.50087 type:complete len:188 (-) Transcript_24127:30-593(-)
MVHLFAKIILSCLLHLGQNHGGNLLRRHQLLLCLHLDADHGFTVPFHDFVGQQLHVLLHGGVFEASTNQTFHIEQGLCGTDGRLMLGRFANEALLIRKSDVTGRNAIALVVGNDFHPAIFVDANTGVGGAQVDSNHRALDLLSSSSCSSSSSHTEKQHQCGKRPLRQGRHRLDVGVCCIPVYAQILL